MSFFDSHRKIYDKTPSIEESLKKLNELAENIVEQSNTKL